MRKMRSAACSAARLASGHGADLRCPEPRRQQGDAVEDLAFEFRFPNALSDVYPAGLGTTVKFATGSTS
jgi:hypothetical protein